MNNTVAGTRRPHHFLRLARATLTPYLAITAGVGVALAGTLLVRPAIQPLVYPLFFIAVTLAGWRFGPGGGMYAVGLSVLLAEGLVLQPAEWTWLQIGARMLVVLACTLPMVVLAARHRQALSTTQQAAQALRESEKMEAVGRLAGGIAHDFNNMLQVIQGNATLLVTEPGLPEEARTSVQEIVQTSARAADLTRQLLVFSRRAPFHPHVVDVARIVRGLHPMLRRLIPEHIYLELQMPTQPTHAHVRADPGQLEQVIMNLVVNARDAMPDGGRIRLTEDMVEHPRHGVGRYCRLVVQDTGPGMDAATLEHIFEPFFTTKPEGTGLGLATVYAVVQECGGHITVASEPGAGATFEILLPESHEPVEAEPAPPVARPSGPAGRRILVVEDESVVRSVITRMLRHRGYGVVCAGNGVEGLRVLASEPVDLVLTDIVMPEMGGLVFAKYIQELYPELPVLFMSGYAPDADAQTAGALQKPVEANQLVSQIERLLTKP